MSDSLVGTAQSQSDDIKMALEEAKTHLDGLRATLDDIHTSANEAGFEASAAKAEEVKSSTEQTITQIDDALGTLGEVRTGIDSLSAR